MIGLEQQKGVFLLPPERNEPTQHRRMDPPYRYFVARKAPVVRPVCQSTNRYFLTTLQESQMFCSDALVRGSFEVEATENSFMSH